MLGILFEMTIQEKQYIENCSPNTIASCKQSCRAAWFEACATLICG